MIVNKLSYKMGSKNSTKKRHSYKEWRLMLNSK